MTRNGFSVEYIAALADMDVSFGNMLNRALVKSYEDFLRVLYDDIKVMIGRLEENPQAFIDESEDATTQRFLDIAFGFGYNAYSVKRGGNIDVSIELTRKGFAWIAEAKKFNSVGDLREGYLQLSSRYRSGMDSAGVMHGGMLGYLRRPNAKECMESWRVELSKLVDEGGISFEKCSRRGDLAFISEHPHQDYGTPLKVWHNCIVLTFDPKDKSGRGAAKYKKIRAVKTVAP